MATFLYPNSGALQIAGNIQADLAASKLKLFQENLTLTAITTQAQLAAAEATFSGYAAIAVAAWQAPYLAPAGGANTTSGYQQWNFVAPAPPAVPVVNMIYGFWLEDAAGNLIAAGTFDAPISMGANGQSVPLSLALNFGQVAP